MGVKNKSGRGTGTFMYSGNDGNGYVNACVPLPDLLFKSPYG